jgi:hypothetical protein
MYFKVPHRSEIATIRFPGWTLFQGVKFTNFTFTRSLHSANRLLNLFTPLKPRNQTQSEY